LIKFNKITIIGVGLIGASFAYALKAKKSVEKIIGYGRNETNLLYAKNEGLIDDYCLDIIEACNQSDLIFLSTPIGTFKDIIDTIKSSLKQHTIITDAGSVKGQLVHDIESSLSEDIFFVGSHPIAGSHKSGAKNYDKNLFYNSLCIITPTKKTHKESFNKIYELWKGIGCRIEILDPFEHDHIYNLVSHMPHLLSFCLVNTVFESNKKAFDFAGKGFKDMSRLAGSSPEIWRDIIIYNKDNVLKSLDTLQGHLQMVKAIISRDDISSLEDYFRKATEIYNKNAL